MRVSEDRYLRDLRRIHLAQRMIRHEVRTTTICAWTGFNEERIRNLAKSYEATLVPASRHRGPPPKKVDVFLRHNLLRAEAACLGGLARSFRILPADALPNAAQSLPGVALGERLCDTFEVYRAVVPEARLTMEHFILLVLALAEGREIELDHCAHCSAVLIVETTSRERRICFACRHSEGVRAGSSDEEGEDEPADHSPPVGVQQSLF
ncbi:MAG TPA: hypothetical protein VG963_03875 [Polyangiaceae bacterium]|nr:hypothetical protein [Polyangiaceae bacterium]